MKKIKTILGLVLVALSLTTVTSCNKNIFDGFNNEFYYVVVKEADEYHMHQIASWSDAESDSVAFTTKCCDNYIWTTANNAVMYKKLPSGLDVKKCSSWKN